MSCRKAITLEQAIITARGFHREMHQLLMGTPRDKKYGRFPLSNRFNRGMSFYFLSLCLTILDEVPLYFGNSKSKTICETNAKAVHTIAPPTEGKRLATLDLFFDATGRVVLPIPLILMGSEVCLFFRNQIYLFEGYGKQQKSPAGRTKVKEKIEKARFCMLSE